MIYVLDTFISPVRITTFKFAGIAQLVERHLAKVNVEGSNPFARSISPPVVPRKEQEFYSR